MGTDFHATRMGQRFFESTMPRIADELARLNRNLEALVALLERRGEGLSPDDALEEQPSTPKPSRSR
jgi:hypothetical protein